MRIVLILLLGLLADASDDEARVYVGKIVAVSRNNLQLSRNESLISIGFVGDPAALAGLDGLRAGEQVRAVFGSTPRPGGAGRINKLLSIRQCKKSDAQCATDGAVQDAKSAEAAKARALSEAKMAQCRTAMDQTLLKDTRYTPKATKIPAIQAQAKLLEVNALKGKSQECATAVMKDHQMAVLEACELHHCGDRIGGGCSHIAGRSLSDSVIERAFDACKDK